MPFLDILVTPEEDGSLKISVLRKTTHTDLYLQWDSQTTIPSKCSVAGTLYHRAATGCSTLHLLHEEHLFNALTGCKYPTWTIKRARMKSQNTNRNRTRRIQTGQNNNKTSLYMVAPYHQGLSERIKRICNKFGFSCTLKEDKSSKTSSWLPRTRILSQTKVEPYIDTSAVNMGVMKNTLENLLEIFSERFKEHQKAPSSIFDHCNTTGHNINNFTIVGREDQNLTRAIKEALFIRVNDPSLNRNIVKYHLSSIWDEVLHKKEFKLKH